MFVTAISVRRDGYFGAYGYGEAKSDAAFKATIEVKGDHGKVELNLSPDLSERIVAIIADEVAAAGRATAEAMTASVLSATPTKALVNG